MKFKYLTLLWFISLVTMGQDDSREYVSSVVSYNKCVSLTASNSNISRGQSIVLKVEGDASFYKVQPGSIILTAGVPALLTPPLGSTTYSIEGLEGKCNSASVTITASSVPLLTITPSKTTIDEGESVTLTPSGLPSGTIYTLLPDNVKGVKSFVISPKSSSRYSIVTFQNCNVISSEVDITVKKYTAPCNIKADFVYNEYEQTLTNNSFSSESTTGNSFIWSFMDPITGRIVYQNTTDSVLKLERHLPNGIYKVCLLVHGGIPDCNVKDEFCLEKLEFIRKDFDSPRKTSGFANPILYPNPNTGKEINIGGLGNVKSIHLVVTDINGELIVKSTVPINEGVAKFDLDVADAMYYVYMEDSDNRDSKANFKLLIQRK